MSESAWPRSDYLVNHEHRFVLCPIPKVASSSLKQWFIESLPSDELPPNALDRPHVALAKWSRNQRPRDLDDYRYVAFVRDPARRLVSAYLQKCVQRWDVPESAARLIVASIHKRQGIPVDYQRGVSFREFVNAICELPVDEVDLHWRPQHLFLPSSFPRKEFDFVGHVERFDEHLLQLNATLGLPTTKRYSALRLQYDEDIHPNAVDLMADDLRRRDSFPAWQSFLDEQVTREIVRYYAADYERLGYDKPQTVASCTVSS